MNQADARDQLRVLLTLVRSRACEVSRAPADVTVAAGAEAWVLKGVTRGGSTTFYPLNVRPLIVARVPVERIADQFISGWSRRIVFDEALQRRHEESSEYRSSRSEPTALRPRGPG
jgi:hypothetical protein